MNKPMTDREYMEDILLTSKTLGALYHYATQEAANQKVHNQFKSNMSDVMDNQHQIYTTMSDKGWYPQQQAKQQQISQLKTKYSKPQK